MAQIESIKVIEINKDGKFVLEQETLKKMQKLFLSDEVKDCSIVPISITGAFRSGKSFLLSFFLKFLRFTYTNENSPSIEKSWLGDENERLQGFQWKSGEERVTTGIQMWPEIFYATLPCGEKVAIILLDTQGLFDPVTTFEVNSKIFALSTMISSLNIYNLSPRIQEDMLQFLKFFTDYSSEALTRVRENLPQAPFGKLLFLVRDWSSPQKYPFGYAGSREMLRSVLEIKGDQKPELQAVRRLLKTSFSDVDAFLMPHPGLKVARDDSDFDGRLSDIEVSFKNSLQELVPSLLSAENLTPKKIEGRKVSAAELFEYFSLYVNKLNSDEMPTPRSIFEANVEISYHMAFEDAIAEYEKKMDTLCDHEQAVETEYLTKQHEEYFESSLARFSNYSKFYDVNSFTIYEEKLKKKILQLYDSYCESNEKKKEIVTLKGTIVEQKNVLQNLEHEMWTQFQNQKRTMDYLETEMMEAKAEQDRKKREAEEKLEQMERELQEKLRQMNRKVEIEVEKAYQRGRNDGGCNFL